MLAEYLWLSTSAHDGKEIDAMAVDLRRMRYLMNREPMARLRVERAMSRATKCTTILTGMPRGGSSGSPVERGVSDLEVAKETLAAIREELRSMRDELRPLIAAVESPLARTTLEMRYMDGYSAREISYLLNYAESHVYRILTQGEREILA